MMGLVLVGPALTLAIRKEKSIKIRITCAIQGGDRGQTAESCEMVETRLAACWMREAVERRRWWCVWVMLRCVRVSVRVWCAVERGLTCVRRLGKSVRDV